MRPASLLLAFAACTGGPKDTGEPAYDGSPIRSCEVVLSTTAGPVSAAGTWNDWAPTPLEDEDGNGVWELNLGELPAGTWAYKFVHDGEWESTPPDVYTTWVNGTENRALVVPDCAQPGLDAVEGSASADGVLSARFQFTRAEDGAPLDTASVTVAGQPVDAAVAPQTGEISIAMSGLAPGKHSVRVAAVDTEGRSVTAFLPLWVEDEPFDWSDGILYYVFTDRFADGGDDGLGAIAGTEWGTDYMGGDLVGATERLDHLDALGVTTIWLSPVNQNPDASFIGADGFTNYSGYHGYWPTKAREVEDRLGTSTVTGDDALRDFVDAAHARGMRVLLDSVLNHVHEDHEYLTTHPEWFQAEPCVCGQECPWDTKPVECWFTSYLPDNDFKQQPLVDQMVADAMWWVETYDVDGFRVDAAKHMDHVIMRTLSMQLRDRYEVAGGADFYLVGETFVGAGQQGEIMAYVAPYELDGQFDFPLLYPLRGAIGAEGGFWDLASEVSASDAAYGEHVHRMSVFFGNHDVSRYATDIAGCPDWALFGGCHDPMADDADIPWDVLNKLALSWAFVVTQPGPPLLYYGDEIGLAGAGDPDNRRMMMWEWSEAQQILVDRVAELGQLRKDTPALQHGERKELWVDGDLYVYARYTDEQVAIIALHRGASTRTQAIPIPTELDLEDKTVFDALGGDHSAMITDAQLSLTLDPWEYVVLTRP